jgi:hypothetical protein
MNSIRVLFYGYKSKELLDAINQTFKNKSNNNHVTIHVVDQTNISRSDKLDNVDYRHVMWDALDSPYSYLDQALLFSKDDYFMYVYGAISFEKDWDLKFIDLAKNESVVSGNKDIIFDTNNYKFYPSYIKKELQKTKNIGWINRDFVFMKTELFKKFPGLSKLKYNGFEEVLSLYAAENNVDIYAVESKAVTKLDNDFIKHDYIPFSLNHGYNNVIDIFKNKNNIFFNSMYCVDLLSSKTKYSFNQLSYLPFSTDDAAYNLSMSLDSKGESRFHDVVRTIY